MIAGWSSLVARRAHNPKVVGSNPAPATRTSRNKKPLLGFFILCQSVEVTMVSETSLRDHLASVVLSLGYEFIGCELMRQGRNTLLRIYIDKEKGVNLDDCALVSRQLSAVLDVEDPIQSRYILEVSSPGMDRPLFELAQYKKVIGKKIKIRLSSPIDNRRNLVGILLAIEEDSKIQLLVDEEKLTLPFSQIEKAKLINVGG